MDIIIQNPAQLEYVQRFFADPKNMELRQFVQFNKGVLSFPDAATQDLVNYFHAQAPESNALRNLSRQITMETGGQITNPYTAASVNQARIAEATASNEGKLSGLLKGGKGAKGAKGAGDVARSVADLPVTAPIEAPVPGAVPVPATNPAAQQALASIQGELAALQPETRGLISTGEGTVASRLAAANQAIPGMTTQTGELGTLVRNGVLTTEEAASPLVQRSLIARGAISTPAAELVPGLGTSAPALTREGINAGRAFNPETFIQGAFGNPSEAAAAQMLSTPQAQIEALANAGGAFNPGLTGAVESAAAKALVPAVEKEAAKTLTREAALGQLKSLGNLNAIGQPKLLGRILTPNTAKAGLSGAEEAALQSLMSGGDAAAAKLAATQAGKAGLLEVGGLLGPRSVGQGLAWGLGGQLASGGLRSILNGERDGSWDNAAEDALSWGGTGAGFGSMFGPWGTAIGGIGGLLAGGIHGLLTGEDSQPKQIRDYLASLDKSSGHAGNLYDKLTLMGLSPQSASQVLAQIGTLASGAKSKAEVEAIVNNVLPNAPALAQQEAAYREQARQREIDSAYFNKSIMPQFQNQLSTMRDDAKAYAAAMQSLIPSYKNQALGKIYAAQAARAPLAADQYISAVQGQLAAYQAMSPTLTQSYYPNIVSPMAAPTPLPSMVPQQTMMSSGLLAPLG